MRSLLLLAFLGAPFVRAHLTASPDHGLRKRIANLEPFRLQATAEYTNSLVTKADAFLSLLKRDTSVETATQLIKATVPGVEFRLTKSYTSGNGVTHVYFKETLHGLDIDNANFNVNIKDGKVFSFGNNLFAGELPAENPLKKQKFIKPIAALASAISTLDLPITFDVSAATIDNAGTFVLKGTFGAEKDPEARLVYFVKADGTLALAWRVETDILDNWLLTYVDAVNTEQVYGVVDYVAAATYQVYPWGVNDPTEGSRSIVTDPWDIEASEFTWQSDGTNEFTVTRGNNAVSLYNPSGNVDYFAGEQPDSSTQDFHYYYSTDATDPLAYRNASITQLFYTANVYHDLLHSMGFDEAAGNFEFNNNRAGGLGDDLTVLYSQHWGGLNNAVFSSPPDGTPGRMFMYMWSRSVPRRDGSFDAGVVIHEYTHGLSSRLTGGASDATCLSAGESSGLGEGWGDFMATAIRLKPGDTRNTNYAMGAWVNNNPAGLRQYLYSTSMTTNPDTYATNNDGAGSHRMGSVWAVMLYEVMWNLIEKYGKNDDPKPIFVDGVPTDGKYLTMQLVVDGMKLQPCNPNFVQARDAILDADVALTGGINACEIWTGFAKRGLGSGARYGTTRTVSMTVPSGIC